MEPHAPPEVRVFPHYGRRHVQDALSPQVGRQLLRQGALAAARAAQDEGADGYSASRIASSSAAFSRAPRTATLK